MLSFTTQSSSAGATAKLSDSQVRSYVTKIHFFAIFTASRHQFLFALGGGTPPALDFSRFPLRFPPSFPTSLPTPWGSDDRALTRLYAPASHVSHQIGF